MHNCTCVTHCVSKICAELKLHISVRENEGTNV